METLKTTPTPQAPTEPTVQTQGKHKSTWGEVLFNWTTYGGFAWLGNEGAATKIVNQSDKESMIGRAYRHCDRFLKGIGTPGKLPYIQQRLNYINFALLGGFLMVPFIKVLEDHKGRCVRFADKIFYGDRAKSDVEIIKRHEEMDNAPVQSWSSLSWGRLLTVAAAYAVDASINWKNGFSARLMKGTRFENYASLEHLSNHAAEWATKQWTSGRSMPPERIAANAKTLENLIGLTTLSATLTLLFYASSKLFARKRDEKIERKEYAKTHAGAPAREEAEPDQPATERPGAQVSDVAHEHTIAANTTRSLA